MESVNKPLQALILALPESAGSSLYGMVDVLNATGNLWHTLIRSPEGRTLIQPRIVGVTSEPFLCGNRIPVQPELAVNDEVHADIIVLPELWLGPDEDMHDRYPGVVDWIRKHYRKGAHIYSVCSGAILLAASGLLDGREATSHWAYADLFRRNYPGIHFRPEPNLCFADASGRIVTSGGITTWHDLAIHIIARHCGPGEAMHIAKVYLLKWHDEGQLPYATLVRRSFHADSVVRRAEDWLHKHFREKHCITNVVELAGIPERSLKRRFKIATGTSLIEYIQNLRVEEAKRLLEQDSMAVDSICAETGYEDAAFFRRLFKRSTGLTPSQYRRMFQPINIFDEIKPKLMAQVEV